METDHRKAAMRAVVVLRTERGEWPVKLPSGLALAAHDWCYALRNRFRWITDERQRARQDARSTATLASLGIGPAALGDLAQGGLVRVVFDGRALRCAAAVEFPWEYMLSAATRASRQGRPFVVVRQIQGGRHTPAISTSGATALLVESAPNPLRRHFNFEAESRLVRASLAARTVGSLSLEELPTNQVSDPTAAALGKSIREHSPTIVHFAGIDSHQAARMLQWTNAANQESDGVILADQDGWPIISPTDEIAALTTAGAVRPRLVVLNFYNTGRNLARLMVEQGVGAALGYFDEFDDSAAEWLIASFYAKWREHDGDAALALADALTNLRDRGAKLEGTGVVVWTRESPRAVDKRRSLAAAAGGRPAPTAVVTGGGQVALDVDARVCPGLNYALLHNNKDLFLTFRLRNLTDKPIGGIRVEVTLRTGADGYPFQAMFDIDEPVVELRDRVRVPLPSHAGDVIRENTQAVIHTRVHAGGSIIYEATSPVKLQSIDEWQLDESSLPWLPAFVFPRDHAIERVLDLAARYVRVITETADFGFPGYQPTGGFSAPDGVEKQVAAIWAAIAYDIQPLYISPLPGGGLTAQRLRTPGETLGYRRGTCVDLALLFAACLEYVEIHPVIFLLEGHAYAGYWRDHTAHAEFCRAQLPADFPRDLVESNMAVSTTAWYAGRPCLQELRRYIAAGSLIPVETQLLAERGSLTNAGQKAARQVKHITGMIDVALARAHRVSSLPLPHNAAPPRRSAPLPRRTST